MNLSDKELGMDRSISRRDFLNGAAAITTVTAIPGGALAGSNESAEAAAVGYPPGRTGPRGSHPGSYEVAHELAWQGRQDWGRVQDAESDVYDLVVVGAGISGLSAAHFYRKEHPEARILILDNHDDFGGHAKRAVMQSAMNSNWMGARSSATAAPRYFRIPAPIAPSPRTCLQTSASIQRDSKAPTITSFFDGMVWRTPRILTAKTSAAISWLISP